MTTWSAARACKLSVTSVAAAMAQPVLFMIDPLVSDY